MKTKTRVNEADVEIGAKLREIRKISGTTQEVLAKQIGVSFQQVQKYERGKNRLSLSKAVEIAKILKVSVLAFLPEEDSDKSNTLLMQENEALKQTLDQIEKAAHGAKKGRKKYEASIKR